MFSWLSNGTSLASRQVKSYSLGECCVALLFSCLLYPYEKKIGSSFLRLVTFEIFYLFLMRILYCCVGQIHLSLSSKSARVQR